MDKVETAVRNLKIGDTMDEKMTIGALISKEHFEKVTGFIERAKTEVNNKILVIIRISGRYILK